jgi:predicted metal-dependent peptidase
VGIARAYQERIDMHFFSHDTKGYYGGLVRNGNVEKIKAINLKGGGGTSHLDVMDMIQKQKGDCKMVVFFTDGYSDLQDIDFSKYDYGKVFVIQNGSDEQLKGKKCKIIKMEKERK